MQKAFYTNSPYNPDVYNIKNDERFIGPILPFIGGALVGYIAGRPQYNYPNYYPVYYPYYPNYYYSTYNFNPSTNIPNNF